MSESVRERRGLSSLLLSQRGKMRKTTEVLMSQLYINVCTSPVEYDCGPDIDDCAKLSCREA